MRPFLHYSFLDCLPSVCELGDEASGGGEIASTDEVAFLEAG